MASEFVRLEGLEGVVDTLRGLPPELVSRRGGVVRSALRKGAQVIQKEWIGNVQRIVAEPNSDGLPSESTGLYEKNISVTRSRPAPGVNGERMVVRVRNKKYPEATGSKPVTTTQVARLLEYGTEKRAPMPAIRPAFESKKRQALDTVVSEINAGIRRVLNKLKRMNRVKG